MLYYDDEDNVQTWSQLSSSASHAVIKTQHWRSENSLYSREQLFQWKADSSSGNWWLCRGMDGVRNYSVRSKTTTTLGWKGRQRKIVQRINFEEAKKVFDKLLRLISRRRKAPGKHRRWRKSGQGYKPTKGSFLGHQPLPKEWHLFPANMLMKIEMYYKFSPKSETSLGLTIDKDNIRLDGEGEGGGG